MVVNEPEPFGRTRNSTEATPADASPAEAEIATLPLTCAPSAGAVSAPLGGVVSILTVAVCSDSTLPALSVEWYSMTCAPSFEWSAGAGTRMEVPGKNEPPSIRCSVAAIPESASAGVTVTVTGVALQPAGASSVVVGSVVSIRTVADRRVSMLPATSVEWYAMTCGPSFEWSAGAGIEIDAPLWNEPPSTR